VELLLTDARWRELVDTVDGVTVFHHPAWSRLLATCYGYRPFVVAIADSGGRIVGGIPVLEVNSWLTGKRWVSLAFSDHCAPLSCDSVVQDLLMTALLQSAENADIRTVEVRAPVGSATGFAETSDSVLHMLPLDKDVDRMVARFHRMHRRNTSSARKRGVTLEHGQGIQMVKQFYRLHLETRRRQGVPVQPWRFFRLLQQQVLGIGLGFVLLAHADGECVAGAVLLHYRDGLVYKYGASSEAGQAARANNLIFDEAIRWGCQNGYRTFDMGKTSLSNTGLRSFKSRWGAEERQLVYSRRSENGRVGHRDKVNLFMEKAIKNSPSIVCRVTGELLYGHFG